MINPHEANQNHPFEKEVDRAIASGELLFLHQPQVELTTGNVIGTEALVRWFHRDLGMLSPGVFLPRLANANALDTLTYFSVDSAIAPMICGHIRIGSAWPMPSTITSFAPGMEAAVSWPPSGRTSGSTVP